MDSPARRYLLDSTAFSDPETCDPSETHTNWEGLFTALGISAVGWTTVALLIVRLFR